MENIVLVGIKAMTYKIRAHPYSVKLTGKERKVLLENGIDAKLFKGKRADKIAYLNEQVQLYMEPPMTNAERQKKFRDKFKAENDNNDYYNVRKEFKAKAKNDDKKIKKEEAKKIVKKKLRFVPIRPPTVRITKSNNRYDTYIYDISNMGNVTINEIVKHFLKSKPLKKNQKIRLIGMKTGYESIYSSTNVFFNDIDFAIEDFIIKNSTICY
jgi:hypothetical protein